MEKKCIVCNEKLSGNRSKFCSLNCTNKFKYNKNKERLNYNSAIRQKMVAIKRKLEFVNLKGGCCSSCGYNKNLSALEFHHMVEHEKSFQLSARELSNTNYDDLLKELDKCLLLCSNCHRELHNKDLNFDNIETLLSEIESNKK